MTKRKAPKEVEQKLERTRREASRDVAREAKKRRKVEDKNVALAAEVAALKETNAALIAQLAGGGRAIPAGVRKSPATAAANATPKEPELKLRVERTVEHEMALQTLLPLVLAGSGGSTTALSPVKVSLRLLIPVAAGDRVAVAPDDADAGDGKDAKREAAVAQPPERWMLVWEVREWLGLSAEQLRRAVPDRPYRRAHVHGTAAGAVAPVLSMPQVERLLERLKTDRARSARAFLASAIVKSASAATSAPKTDADTAAGRNAAEPIIVD